MGGWSEEATEQPVAAAEPGAGSALRGPHRGYPEVVRNHVAAAVKHSLLSASDS